MPCNYKLYAKNWFSEIRPSILEKAKGRCQFCDIDNYSVGYRKAGVFHLIEKFQTHKEARSFANEHNQRFAFKYIVIVLTIAHLDQDIENNDPQNLKALCQRCHLLHDRPYRRRNKYKRIKQLSIIEFT